MKNIGLISSLILCISVLMTSTGCAGRIAFTQGLRDKYRLTDEEIENLQFYINKKIILERDMVSGDREISRSHQLITRQGRQIDQVIIKKGTPGITTSCMTTALSISFEQGSFIWFGTYSGQGDRYGLIMSPWREGNGDVTFENLTYQSIGAGETTHLLISKKSLLAVERNRRILRGRTLPPDP